MRINSFGEPCVPVPDQPRSFMMSVLEDEERAILRPDGKSVIKEVVSVSRRKPIPHEVFENRGITCDLFGVEVSQKAGVQLHEFTSQFYGVSLESREALENLVNLGLDSIESQLNQSNNSSINFE